MIATIITIAGVLCLTCTLSNAAGMADKTSLWTEMAKPNNNALFSKYTVVYHPNGGTGQTIEESVDANTDYKIKTQGYVNRGFGFDGWNTRPDGKGTSYSINQVVKITDNITLYAKWVHII